MGSYLRGDVVRALREARGLTQRDLAEALGVTDKAVSKWETGRGLPDITLVEPLARALGVSVAELFAGEPKTNANRSGNMMRTLFHVCPLCGNVVTSLGEGAFSCCGCDLAPCEPEEPDSGHGIMVEHSDGDWHVTLDHPMDKEHHLSFIALVGPDRVCVKKLYPEQAAQARFRSEGPGIVYAYCNKHGLFKVRTPRVERVRRAPDWLS